MFVMLVNRSGDSELIKRIAGICYGNDGSNINLRNLINKGHLSPLRFMQFTFLVKGVTIACARQVMRHKHLDFMEKSLRYTKPCSMIHFINTGDKDIDGIVDEFGRNAFELYDFLVQRNVPKQHARYILPQGTETEFFVTGNAQAWMHFLKVRMMSDVMPETMKLAWSIFEILNECEPDIFFREEAEAIA